jgi:REP element-mobilizing transposase RayT
LNTRFDPDKHRRRSTRLKGYDYAEPGAYFITVAAQMREPFFGEVMDGYMQLNDAGRMVVKWWRRIPGKFPSIEADEYTVMPDHFHGIAINVGADTRVCPGPPRTPLSRVVQWFKTMTTNAYIKGVKNRRWTPFERKLWQRNYYDRIIRDEEELNLARQYVLDNPAKWTLDQESPRQMLNC